MSLQRLDLVIVGLLTGHVALNRHLTMLKVRTDPLCQACGEEYEVPTISLGDVQLTYMVTSSVLFLESHLMQHE